MGIASTALHPNMPGMVASDDLEDAINAAEVVPDACLDSAWRNTYATSSSGDSGAEEEEVEELDAREDLQAGAEPARRVLTRPRRAYWDAESAGVPLYA